MFYKTFSVIINPNDEYANQLYSKDKYFVSYDNSISGTKFGIMDTRDGIEDFFTIGEFGTLRYDYGINILVPKDRVVVFGYYSYLGSMLKNFGDDVDNAFKYIMGHSSKNPFSAKGDTLLKYNYADNCRKGCKKAVKSGFDVNSVAGTSGDLFWQDLYTIYTVCDSTQRQDYLNNFSMKWKIPLEIIEKELLVYQNK